MRTASDRVHVNHAKRSTHYIKGGGIMDDHSDYAELSVKLVLSST